jgi:DNA-damage-inducible protein D
MEATGLPENEIAGKKGGGIAKKARLELEEKTGKRIVSGENYLPPKSGKQLGEK